MGEALASVLTLTSHWCGTAGAEHWPFQILQACEQMEERQERLRTTKADGTFTLGYSVKICVWAASFSLSKIMQVRWACFHFKHKNTETMAFAKGRKKLASDRRLHSAVIDGGKRWRELQVI